MKARHRSDETTKKPQSSESVHKHRINAMTRNGDGRSHSSGLSNSTPKREAISGTGFAIKLNIIFFMKNKLVGTSARHRCA